MSHLNRTNIEWCTRTFNPVTGCKHNCPYCYARKIAMRFTGHFKPEFHPDRLDAPARAKKPQRIFVGSMCDLFGDWVPYDWIEKVLKACKAAPWHTYYFLTKNYGRIILSADLGGYFDKYGWWEGETIESGEKIFDGGTLHQFVSIEPMLGQVILSRDKPTSGNGSQWVIVGAQTNPTVMPERKWVLDIREQCRALEIPLFEKNSLKPLMGDLIQEVP